MPNDVLRFLKNALLLLGILVLLDRVIGAGLERLFYRQKHGDDATTAYVLEQARPQLLIFGSSRASHHYKSAQLSGATGLSCFNGGRDEMTITYSGALLPIIYQRYKPELVLVELLPTELAGNDRELVYQRIATVLLPFAHRQSGLEATIGKAGAAEIWKMRLSRIYAYNSLIGSAFQNAYTSLGHHSELGYEPLYQQIDSANYRKPIWGDFTRVQAVDTGLVHTLENLIHLTRSQGSRLVLLISPLYFRHPVGANPAYRKMQELAQREQVPLFDFTQDSRFLLHPRLFNDDVHLNDSGASLFTRILADTLLKEGLIPGKSPLP